MIGRYISFFIILAVGCLVFGVAGTILYLNLASNTSNYRVVRKEIQDHSISEWFQSEVQAVEPAPTTLTEPDPTASKSHALQCQEIEQRSSTNLVDYLSSIGRPNSFAARAELAQNYGFENYRGTAKENVAILNEIRTQDLQEANCAQ